jgi:hypothetical protein
LLRPDNALLYIFHGFIHDGVQLTCSPPKRKMSLAISTLEHQKSSHPLAVAELIESIINYEGQLTSVCCLISVLDLNHRTELKELESGSTAPITTSTSLPPVSRSKSLKGVEFQLKMAKTGDLRWLGRKEKCSRITTCPWT